MKAAITSPNDPCSIALKFKKANKSSSLLLKSLTLLIVALISAQSFCQRHAIYDIEQRLMRGKKEALYEMAPYFDSQKKLIEYLGYHRIETNESQVAKRIIDENCLFTNAEISSLSELTSQDFVRFLRVNSKKLFFSELAGAFMITPLESRTAKITFRDLSVNKKQTLQAEYHSLLQTEWAKKSNIASLILKENPAVLRSIASELFKTRYRFNTHHYNANEYTSLLQLLTGKEFAVENERKELTWHADKEFYPDATLNLLIYFSGNYSKFRWNSDSSYFKNEEIKANITSREDILFELLSNQNDSIALTAFTQLTTCSQPKVVQLAYEYGKARIETNNALPLFAYKFLQQLTALTEYCRQNNINFSGSKELKSAIINLDSNLSFSERRKLEDSLINNLKIEEITAFEYWAVIYEQSWGITYSAGRILDIFYSRHFNDIIKTEPQLTLYLKKAVLFDRLGIIGICNNYLKKFTGISSSIENLTAIKTIDKDLITAVEKAKWFCSTTADISTDTMKVNDGNRDYNIPNIIERIQEAKKTKEKKELENEIVELLSKINYSQIGEALKAIEDIKFENQNWSHKYTFMERDWGFFPEDSFDSLSTRNNFLKRYNELSEYELYSYYLKIGGIEYKGKDNMLLYDNIYDILKYNVVAAFVGGGGGRRDNEVYAIIKILELTHKTTLGYPRKLCNSAGIYGCDSHDRANEWMKFIKSKNLTKEPHNEPVSFNFK